MLIGQSAAVSVPALSLDFLGQQMNLRGAETRAVETERFISSVLSRLVVSRLFCYAAGSHLLTHIVPWERKIQPESKAIGNRPLNGKAVRVSFWEVPCRESRRIGCTLAESPEHSSNILWVRI
jgi:hypothetical protein